MRLTPVLHGYLNRVWGKDPKAVNAFTLAYAGSAFTWTVEDQVLTTTVAGGPGAALTIDLTQYTLQTLCAYLGQQAGYIVSGYNGATGHLAAIVLLDAQGGAGPLQAYTSLRWAIFDAMAKELTDAEATAAAAPGQLSTTSASGFWLDVLGDYLGRCTRNPVELDGPYAIRIIAEIIAPKCNNVAIEAALEQLFGLRNVSVVDTSAQGPDFPTFDGSIQFDGAYTYNPQPTVVYGLFNVSGTYSGPQALAALDAAVASFLDATLRATGCHLKTLTITAA